MRVRAAQLGDVTAILGLDPSADATDLRRPAVVEQMATGTFGWCLVAERATSVVGVVLVRPGHLLGQDEVTGLRIAPRARREGAGRALLAAAIGAATTDPVLGVVPVGNVAARALCAAAGWLVSGRLEGVGAEPVLVVRSPRRAPGPAAHLYHLTLRQEWDRALREGVFRSSTLGLALADVGYVHCCFARQLPLVARAHFGGVREPLVLLTIDRSRLSVRVTVEPAAGTDEVFPHIYGPVDLGAVVEVTPVPRDPDGGLVLPLID